jgi:hypothetical protein
MTFLDLERSDADGVWRAAAGRARKPAFSLAAAFAALSHMRRDASLFMLLRALGVLTALGALATVSFSVADRAAETRPASIRRASRAVPPLVALARHGDGAALDEDFSLEQAAATWARRLSAKEAAQGGDYMRFGPMRVPRAIVAPVVEAAMTTGSDPALLMAIADKESSFAPRAKASTSSASGLFQFVESTWLNAVRMFGWRYGREKEADAIRPDDAGKPTVASNARDAILRLRDDPYLSAALAAEMLKKDGDRIAHELGRNLSAGETYLIHFLGPEDAVKFIRKVDATPNISAAELLPRPAKANKPIFYKREGKTLKDRSVGEVHQAFEEMMGKRATRYRDVAAKLPDGVNAYAETR